jgi:hypothetical protein
LRGVLISAAALPQHSATFLLFFLLSRFQAGVKTAILGEV